MDPLFVIGSVVGIIAVTGKLTSSLVDFIRRERDAPASMHGILAELSALRACLSQLQPFMQGSKQASRTRTSQISVEQLVTINTSCVLTLSELDKMMDSFKLERPFSLLDKMQWAKSEPKIRELVSRVRTSQSSLNMILAIFTCTTVNEIRMAVDSLVTAVETIRSSSEDVSRRLVSLETSIAGVDTSAITGLGSLPCAEASCATTSNEVTYNQLECSESYHSTTTDMQHIAASYIDGVPRRRDSVNLNNGFETDSDAGRIGTDLELLLQESRAYSHGMSRDSNILRPYSRTSMAGWSLLSAISLSQVTNISVLSLPVSIHELWNKQNYQSNPNSPQSHDRSGENKGISRITRKKAGNQKFWIGQRWLNSLSEARRREGLPVSEANNNLVPGYNIVAQPVIPVISPQIKLVLAVLLSRCYVGNSASGKSTMLKQMRIAYAARLITPREREDAREVLFENVISEVGDSPRIWPGPGPQYQELALLASVGKMKIADWIEIPTLQQEWFHELVKAAESRVDDNTLSSTVQYYLRHHERLHSKNYAANDKDFLHAYVKTTGIHETYLESHRMRYRVVDISGHSAERKKWPYDLEIVDCLVFVASLAAYDNYLVHQDLNEMQDSLALFESLMKSTCLTTSTIVLLFNKVDIFRGKIKQSPISDFGPEYSGREGDYDAATKFFTEKFCAMQQPGDRREIYVYFSDATNIETSGIILQSIEALMFSRKEPYYVPGIHGGISPAGQYNMNSNNLVHLHR